MKNYPMEWPVDGVCNMGCPYYVAGSIDDSDSDPGEHCRFGNDGVPKFNGYCGASASPDLE